MTAPTPWYFAVRCGSGDTVAFISRWEMAADDAWCKSHGPIALPCFAQCMSCGGVRDVQARPHCEKCGPSLRPMGHDQAA